MSCARGTIVTFFPMDLSTLSSKVYLLVNLSIMLLVFFHVLWRNKKNIMQIDPLIWSYVVLC